MTPPLFTFCYQFLFRITQVLGNHHIFWKKKLLIVAYFITSNIFLFFFLQTNSKVDAFYTLRDHATFNLISFRLTSWCQAVVIITLIMIHLIFVSYAYTNFEKMHTYLFFSNQVLTRLTYKLQWFAAQHFIFVLS